MVFKLKTTAEIYRSVAPKRGKVRIWCRRCERRRLHRYDQKFSDPELPDRVILTCSKCRRRRTIEMEGDKWMILADTLNMTKFERLSAQIRLMSMNRIYNPKIPKGPDEAFEELVNAFREYKVKFMVHGAQAVGLYGFERNTDAFDFIVEPSPQNLKRLYRALNKIIVLSVDYPDAGSVLEKKPKIVKYLYFLWPVDIAYPDNFDTLWKRRSRVRGLNVIGRKDLIKEKLRRGTPQDLVDVQKLREFERMERER